MWIYVRYVLAELERSGEVTLLNDLPDGLWNYYYNWWSGWKAEHPQSWRTVDLPVLATLACARAPMTVSQLAAINNVPPEAVADLMESWLPFLDVEQANHHRRFSIYHASLTRFLSADDDDARGTEVATAFTGDLFEAMRAAHRRTADRYIEAWGGLDSGLAGLGDAAVRGLDDGYGLRNVVHHLIAVDDDALAQALVESQWDDAPNAWHEAHVESEALDEYLADVLVLRERAHAATRSQLQSHTTAPSAGREFGLALLMRTAKLKGQGVSHELRAALVRQGLWSVRRALASARMLGASRAQALVHLASVLDEQDARALWEEALEVARSPSDPTLRFTSLRAIVALLPERHHAAVVEELLAIARTAGSARAMSLRFVAPLTEGDQVWREALTASDDKDKTLRSVDLQFRLSGGDRR